MQGFLHFLLFGRRSADPQSVKSDMRAKSLREWYIFKVIPILNPDGVVCGNYRSTVSGVDLNRQWADPHKNYHPVAYYARRMVEQIQRDRKVIAFCDLHGHSKLQNSFIYGCGRAADGKFSSWTKVRLLPRILAKQTHFFNYAQCRFKVTPSKQGTARVVLWKDFGITNSFTLQTSFLGYSLKKTNQISRDRGEIVIEKKEFSISDLEWIGCSFAKALAQFYLLNKQIERETALTNGWLKPYKLIEMTGTTAVEKIVKEIEAKERLQRREQFIKNYLARIGRTLSSSVSEKKPEQNLEIQRVSYDGFSDDGTVKGLQFDTQNSSSPHLQLKQSSHSVTRAGFNSNFNSVMFHSLELDRESKQLDSTLMSRIGTPPSHIQLNQSVSPYLDSQLLVTKKRQQREDSIDRFYSQLKYFQMQRDERTNYKEEQLHQIDLEKIYQIWECQKDAKLPEWREYFAENELKEAFEKINQGEDPEEVHDLLFALRNSNKRVNEEGWQTQEDQEEEGDDDSDSEAELDNLNEELLADLEISPEHSISVSGSPNNSPRHSHASDFRMRLESLSFNKPRVSPINEKNEEELSIRKRKLNAQQTPIDEYVSRGSTPRSELKDLDRVSSKESEITKFTAHKKQNFITEIKIRSQDRSSSISKRSQYFVHQKKMEQQQSELRSKFEEHAGSGILSESNNRSRHQMLPRYHNLKASKETETPSEFVVLPVTKINFPTPKQSIPKPQKTKLPFLKRTGLTLNVPPPISMEDRVNALHQTILKKSRILKLNELKMRKSSYHQQPNSASILQDTLFNSRFNKTGFPMNRAANSQDYSHLGGVSGGKVFRSLMGSSYDNGGEKSDQFSGIPTDSKMGKTSVLWDNQGFSSNIVEEISKGGDRTFQSYKFQQKIADQLQKRQKLKSRQEMRGPTQTTEERGSQTQADSSLAERSTSDKMIAQEIEAIVASIKETHDRHMNKFHLMNSAKKKKARETAKLLGFSPFHSNFAK